MTQLSAVGPVATQRIGHPSGGHARTTARPYDAIAAEDLAPD